MSNPPDLWTGVGDLGGLSMSRLTRRAEQILEAAKQIAAEEFGRAIAGTEHLLLAIVRENSGVGAQLMRDHGVTEARVRAEIARSNRVSLDDTLVLGQLAGTPNYVDVMDRAVRAAKATGGRSGSNWQIGSIHLLVGLLGSRDSTGCKILRKLGITGESFRKALAQAVSDRSGVRRAPQTNSSDPACRESAA